LVQAAGRCNNRYVEGLKVGVEDSGRIEDLGQKDLVETRA
jgi:predicted methyltransferase MtxX (methanogen marker protein 4)